jgi:N4-gp56 family major capsid protein
MFIKNRRLIAGLHLATAFVVLFATQSIAAFFAVWAVNPLLTQQLHSSYTRINVLTEANMVAMDSKAQEELWIKRIIRGAEQANVFSDEMIGGPGSGKPFVQYDDLSKVDGNTIHVPTIASLGGPGAQGEGDRSGNEEKLRIGSFPCQIGRQWFGIGITDVAIEETVIGSQWDNLANKLLRMRLGRKISEDLKKNLITAATSAGINLIRPNFKASREALKSADVVNTPVITRSGLLASGNGAKPVGTIRNPGGGMIEQFLFFGNQLALANLKSETAYLDAVKYAQQRGNGNPIFKGDFVDWDGHGIYRELIRDHDAFGPIGSVTIPRAFLGTAIAADNSAHDITGGGSATGAALVPAPAYFEAFSNAPWTYTNGTTVAAVTNVTRYVAIYNLTGADAGKIGIYSYQVNDGNKLTMINRLRAAASGAAVTTLGNITWNAAPWVAATYLTDAHPIGSLVIEINSFGVPFCYSFMLGEMAGICGYGSLKGRNAKAARTEEHRNHGMDHGIGVETVFGSAATQRTDGRYPNFVVVESAWSADGFPTVT